MGANIGLVVICSLSILEIARRLIKTANIFQVRHISKAIVPVVSLSITQITLAPPHVHRNLNHAQCRSQASGGVIWIVSVA